VTDSIIYEAQPIPPEEPEDQNRQRRRAIFGGAALIIMLLVAVVVGASLFGGNDEPDPEADADLTATSRDQTVTTVATPARDRTQTYRNEGGGDAASSPYRPRSEAPPTPPLPSQEFNWQMVTLDLPAGEEVWLQGVYAVDDGFLAFGLGAAEGGQQMTAWRSSDGSTWELTQLNGDFSDASVWNIRFNEHGAVALGEGFQENAGDGATEFRRVDPARLIWTSRDGINWVRSELTFETAVNQTAWINTGVAGPSEFVVVGHRETSPEFEPLVIEKDGFTVTIDEYSYNYKVEDAAGAVVAQGSLEEFYADEYNEDGQVVTNPETGEVLTVVPWITWEQAWEAAYNESSSGPFGGYDYTPPVVTIEHDGYRITVDEERFTYEIVDVASGEIISAGNAEYLWRGPAPAIHDENGNEIISFTWEEFESAQQAFWEREEVGDGEYQYRAEMIVAVSTDGLTWTDSVLESGAQETSFDSIVVLGGQFFAYGNQYDENGGGSAIWSSPDGSTWTRIADMPENLYLWNVQQAPDGTLLAMGDGPDGPALWSSSDGTTWRESFGARIPEDPNTSEWMNQFGTGHLGTVVVGSRETGFYEEEYSSDPLTLSGDGYTLSYDDYDTWPPRVTVVDDATGDVVIDIVINEEGGLPEGFSYEDGVTYIEHNDTVLMVITDEDWQEAQEQRWQDVDELYAGQRPTMTMYFSTDLEAWVEVPIDFEGWISTVAVGTDSVVLAGEEAFDGPALLEHEGAEGAIGQDLVYEAPNPILWVGRP